MKKNHCCDELNLFLSESELYFGYNQVERQYYIMYSDGGTAVQLINYCPWCGSKLPKELTDEWWDTLEKEYGIEDPRHDDKDKVPEEFKTDEWWKKRGL